MLIFFICVQLNLITSDVSKLRKAVKTLFKILGAMETALPGSGSLDQVDSAEAPAGKEKKKKNMYVMAYKLPLKTILVVKDLNVLFYSVLR